MSGLGSVITKAAPALQIGGTVLSAYSSYKGGRATLSRAKAVASAEEVTADFEATQQEYLAGQAKASSQRAAYEERRMAALLASKALANAAGSGAGVSDPDVMKILADIQAEGAYRSAVALYEGESEARNRTIAAKARRLGGTSAAMSVMAEGRGAARAGTSAAFSTLLSGTSNWMERYGTMFSQDA